MLSAAIAYVIGNQIKSAYAHVFILGLMLTAIIGSLYVVCIDDKFVFDDGV